MLDFHDQVPVDAFKNELHGREICATIREWEIGGNGENEERKGKGRREDRGDDFMIVSAFQTVSLSGLSTRK